MAQHEPTRGGGAAPAALIPDKLYFRIGEVARLCEVPAYVLRFWESEFPLLKPNKGGTGQRLYRRRDVETAIRIKALLYGEGYTIPGARQVLKAEAEASRREPMLPLMPAEGPAEADPERQKRMQKLRQDLEELHGMLSRAPSRSSVHRMPQRSPNSFNRRS